MKLFLASTSLSGLTLRSSSNWEMESSTRLREFFLEVSSLFALVRAVAISKLV